MKHQKYQIDFFSRAWLWSPPVEHCVSLKFLLQYGNSSVVSADGDGDGDDDDGGDQEEDYHDDNDGNSSVVSADGHDDGDGGDGDYEEDYAISYCWEY